jgi:hypothetical protein
MENIKIFITSEANNALSEKSAVTDKFQEEAINGIYSVIKSRSCSECMFFDDLNPFGISAIWAKSPEESTYILLYKNKPGCPIGYSIYPTLFFEQIKKSIPFSLT